MLDGGDTGEFVLATAVAAEYCFIFGWGVETWCGAAGVNVSILLGPERTSLLCVGLLSWWHRACASYRFMCGPVGLWVGVGGVCVGVGVCLLRIA